MKKVIFIESVHEILHERLSALGYQCENCYENSRDEILNSMHAYEGVVLRSRIKIDKAFLDASPNLKFIARSGSGLENIDVKEAELRGIQVFSSPEGNRDAVASHGAAVGTAPRDQPPARRGWGRLERIRRAAGADAPSGR